MIFNRKKINIFSIVIIVLLVTVVIMLLFFNPAHNIFAPKCLFYTFTGYKCVGCGTQRALYSLFHFRFDDFVRYNPILIFAIPYIILIIYLQYFKGKEKFPKMNNIVNSKTSVIILLILVLAYWILRNIFSF